ncbi:protein croquemort-like [Palaemon carinicauda]|uniref:protein croquemort-like n=1 Tax=Palaemon carinicauda TaxID=392227 RepID=UPI0035B63C9E
MDSTEQSKGHDNAGFVHTQQPPTYQLNQNVVLSVSSLENDHQHSMQKKLITKSKAEKCSKLSGCQIFLLVSGLLSIILSVAMLAGCFWLIFNAIMQSQMELREGTDNFDMWKKTPFPMILKLYIFNITNHEDFLNGAKPKLKECGPYIWREYHEKKEIEFFPNNTVTYMQQRWWIWDEERSGTYKLDDMVYAVNPIPLSATWSVRYYPKYLVNPSLKNLNRQFNELGEKAVVKATVNDLVFEGFQDPILDWIQENVVATNGSFHWLLPLINLPPGLSDYDRFGWFYMRNMSLGYDGIFNMMTGADDYHNIGIIDMWNYTKETTFFEVPCNAVVGSAGEYFSPDLERDKLVFYSSDLCMSVKLEYQKDVDMDGLSAYRFWGSKNTFANGSLVPGNECYCVKGTCAPTGLLNAESCRMGSPAFISFPHYFNADPFLLDQIEGLKPEEDKHAFIMDIMPEAGVPVNVEARMQINMRVIPYPGTEPGQVKIDILEKVPDIYLPMIWFEVTADVPEDMIDQLKVLQFIKSSPVMTICFSVFLLLGLCSVAYVIYVVLRK